MAKGNTANDLKEKSDAELAELLRSSKSELFTARFENFTNKLNDTAKIRRLRKDIARVQTVLSARRRGGEHEGGVDPPGLRMHVGLQGVGIGRFQLLQLAPVEDSRRQLVPRLGEILDVLASAWPELTDYAVAHAFGDPHGPLQVGDRTMR